VYRVAKVLDVTDGNTLDVLLDLGFGILARKRVRLAEIDAPETRTTDRAEKHAGRKPRRGCAPSCLTSRKPVLWCARKSQTARKNTAEYLDMFTLQASQTR
jgi:endonuclease YncB( thermonuclease family)